MLVFRNFSRGRGGLTVKPVFQPNHTNFLQEELVREVSPAQQLICKQFLLIQHHPENSVSESVIINIIYHVQKPRFLQTQTLLSLQDFCGGFDCESPLCISAEMYEFLNNGFRFSRVKKIGILKSKVCMIKSWFP